MVRGDRNSRSPISLIGQPGRRQPRDALLLRRQLAEEVGATLGVSDAGGAQLDHRALEERGRAEPLELFACGLEHGPGLDHPTSAAEPFAVVELRLRELERDVQVRARDRTAEELVRSIVGFRQERPGPVDLEAHTRL